MNAKNIPAVQSNFLDKINKNMSFIVWSGIGTGSLATVMDYFDKPEYKVERVNMPQIKHDTLMEIPVIEENDKISYHLSNEMQAVKNARDTSGQTLVLIFDDLSSSTVAGSRAFYEAVINRKFGGIELKPSDIVFALGKFDSEGDFINNVIPTSMLNNVAHYVLHS